MGRENALESDASEKTEADEKHAFSSRHRAFKPGEDDDATEATDQHTGGDRYAGLRPDEEMSEESEKQSEGEADFESKQGFGDEDALEYHFNKHRAEFNPPFATKEEYEGSAKNFMHGDKSDSTLERTRPNGDRVRYNPETEEYGVARRDDVIRTYFKLDLEKHDYSTNREYFENR